MVFNKEKYRQTVIAKYGSWEAYREAQRQYGHKGGKSGTGHGFAHGKLSPKATGSLGGIKTRENRKKQAQ